MGQRVAPARPAVTVHRVVAAVRKRWMLWTIVVLLVVLLTTVASFLLPKSYSAETRLFIATRSDTRNTGQLQQGDDFAANRARSYVDVATSTAVLKPVVDSLSLPMTTEQLASRTSVNATPQTVTLTIAVTDGDPVQAAAIANAIGRQLADFVQRIESPAGPNVSPVRVTTITEAVPPPSPSSPVVSLNVLAALVAGVALASIAAYYRDVNDTRVRRATDIEGLEIGPVMAEVPAEARGVSPSLHRPDFTSPRWESFRRLRTNLQYTSVDRAGNVVLVTSPSEGDGKSSIAISLAISFAQAGSRVCVIDADLRKPKVAEYLHVVADVGLTPVLIGRARAEDAIQEVSGNFSVLASGPVPPNPTELLASDAMLDVVDALSRSFDIVLVDAPPILPVADSASLAARLGRTLIVANASRTTAQDLTRSLRFIEEVGGRAVGYVLNNVEQRHLNSGYGYGYGPGAGVAEAGGAYIPERPRPSAGAPEPTTTQLNRRARSRSTGEPAHGHPRR